MAGASRALPRKVCVFTTSYPRGEDDFAGRFVSGAVERLRERGIEVSVVAPGEFRTFGVASDGGGIVRAVRRRPWTAPLLFSSMVRTLRRAARDADLVHAHWFAGGLVALFAGRPFVVTLHGTISGGVLDDFKLLRSAPRLARLVLDRASAVICVSEALTEAARAAGVENAVFIPNGIDLPAEVGVEAEPPEILYTGRLAPEKGIEDLVEAAAGLNLVVSGDGPLRSLVPSALGFLPRAELERRYERAAVVVCPSRSEGFGVVCAEAMAHGKPVVATAVGGLANLVEDGKTGVVVPPRRPDALRAALEGLLADPAARERLGRAGREKIAAGYSWESVIEKTLGVYSTVLEERAPERQPHAVLDVESRTAKATKIERLLDGRCRLEGARILDIGTGSGVIAGSLAKRVGPHGEVVAVDLVDQRLSENGYRFVQVTGTALPFEDGSFDLVVSNHILDHVGGRPEKEHHLAEIRRVLRPGGCCYLTVANRWVLVEPHFRLPFLSWLPEGARTPYVRLARRGRVYDCDLPTRGAVLELVREAGFEHEELELEALGSFAELEGGTLATVTSRVPRGLLEAALPVFPTVVLMLRKKGA
ncbi:MAG TPA: glycosyltransferase [Gaiellaceae bacterium]|nr:glycosyltransferase [Gaiellaceae bacterium]